MSEDCSIIRRLPNKEEEKRELHSIPCKVEFTGPANISGYFKQDENQENAELKCSTFRGRGLQGSLVAVPEEYQLFVLKKRNTMKPQYDVEATYDKVNVWEWDRSPGEKGSRTDFSRALSFLQVAQTLASDD